MSDAVPGKPFEVLLDSAFPFHFGFDAGSKVTRVGRSMRKVCQEFLPGAPLKECVSIQRPRIDMDFSTLHRERNLLFMFELLSRPLKLRGQLCCIRHELVFLGSPWLCSVGTIEQLGLQLSDFAVHDVIVDNLLVQQSQSTQLADLKRMVQKLRAAAEEKKKLAAAEQTLVHDLDAAGDVRIRFSRSGTIFEATATRTEYLPDHERGLIGLNLFSALPAMQRRVAEAESWFDDHRKPYPFEYDLETASSQRHFEARLARTLHGDLLLVATDVTERRQFAARLQHRALHDPLTDLPNRTRFEQRLKEASGEDQRCAVLLIDLDDFKSVNDVVGHSAGDEVLRTVAARIRRSLRKADTPARLAGDEFGVLVHDLDDLDAAHGIADELLTQICQPVICGDRRIEVRVSIGVAVSRGGSDAQALFRNAGLAKDEAKSRPKNAVVAFDPSMYQSFAERLTLKQELKRAVDQQEITAYYQPIIDLRTGRIHGLEALARWDHPQRGILPPVVFIEMAEQSGLIVDLGRQILAQACHEVRALNRRLGEELTVHVNLSPLQVQHHRLVRTVDGVLTESGLPENLLTLEITETSLFADMEQAERVLRKLKGRGLNVALDDFGVGYSSLRYLERFPIDVLKLDRSFVSQVDKPQSRGVRLLEPIVRLGLALDLDIVAEGIESPQQARLLSEYGCQFAQGYHYGRPMPMTEVEQFLPATQPELAVHG